MRGRNARRTATPFSRETRPVIRKRSRALRASRRSWAPFVLVAGLGLLWTIWKSGGDFWPAQRPFMHVTVVCAAILTLTVTLVALLPRSALRGLLKGAVAVAILAMFLGEGLAERSRFDRLSEGLSREVEAVARGGDCTTPCRIESRTPLRVAFLLSGGGEHWSGACYDATDIIYGVEYGGRVRPPDAHEAPILAEAKEMFGGQVRHAPAWGRHWYGCSTRP